MIMTESSFGFRINENNRSNVGLELSCNTYDMGVLVWVRDDQLKRDCQFVYFRTEFNYPKKSCMK